MNIYFIYQFHVVSRTQQGKLREPSARTLCFPLSAKFFEALRVLWQNSLPWCQNKEMKVLINNNSFPRVGLEATTVTLQSHPCATEPR